MSQIIGSRYEIRNLIGHGAMGQVYLGYDLEDRQEIAIKELRPEFIAQDPELVTRFEREADVLRRLNHPNIVKMHGTFAENDRHYLVMDYVGGGSLRDVIRSQSPLAIPHIVDIGIELSDALARVHRLDIIHRDIKPANVLLDIDGTPRLTDFGVAHVTDETRLTQTGYVFGTYAYVSPEACFGTHIDARTDIWSFGVMLYELLIGTVPFHETSPAAIVTAILSQPAPDMRKLRPDIPEALANLIYQMLQKDPERRISSVRKIGTILETILQGNVTIEEVYSVTSTGQAYLPDETITPIRAKDLLAASRIQHNLPTQATPFVGRVAEVAAIAQAIHDSECRLMTLRGAGGIGKTRLAIEVGQRTLNAFADGVYFVGLASVSSAEFVLQAVADALNFTFYGPPNQHRAQLINYLREKQILLIMDNFEHVLEAADLVDEMLNAAPKLKILATSREALHLQQEWIRHIAGMTYPESDDTATFDTYSAVQLFIDSARRVKSDFDAEAQRACILRILRLVDGLPLGIELATAWLRLLSCEKIGDEIETNLDFLATKMRNVADRHQSLRAVFEYSWALMSDDEREILARLSVFKGGFDRQAAETAIGASLRTLIGLVDKSMLQRVGSERYDMHLLIRQYAAEKLSADEKLSRDTAAAHSSYYLDVVARQEAGLKGANQKAALAAIDMNIDNVREAWHWAVSHQGYADLNKAMLGLYLFYSLRNWFAEAAELYKENIAVLDEAPATQARDWVLGQLLGIYGSTIGLFESREPLQRSRQLLETLEKANYSGAESALKLTYHYLGRNTEDRDERRDYLERSLAISRKAQDDWGILISLNSLGDYAWQPGDIDQAKAYYQQAKQSGKKLGNQLEVAYALNAMGNIGWTTGDYEMGKAAYQEAVDIFKAFNSRAQWAIGVFNLGDIYLDENDLEHAEPCFNQSLELSQAIGFYYSESVTLARFAQVERLRGNDDQAMRLLRQSQDVAENIGNFNLPIDTIREFGYIALSNGNLPEARRHFNQLMERIKQHIVPLFQVEMLQGSAELAIAEGDFEMACAILSLMIHHPASRQQIRLNGRRLLSTIQNQIPHTQCQVVQSGSTLETIDNVIIKILQSRV